MDAVFLAFLELGSSNSSSTGPYSGTCSRVAFLLVFLEDAFWVGGVLGTCWGPYSARTFPISLAGELSPEETISSTCVSSYSEALAYLGVQGGLHEVNLEDFLEDFVEVFLVFSASDEGEDEDLDWRNLNL